MNAIAPLSDDEPVRLKDAPAVFFPAGNVTLSTLRTEIRKKRLIPTEIAGKFYVTPRQIQDMLERCRDRKSRLASPSAATGTENDAGSSETADAIAARDALIVKMKKRLSRSPTISEKAAGRTRSNVVPIRSASPTS